MNEYLEDYYVFYGEFIGVCIVCKYIGWYICGFFGVNGFWY